MSILEAALEIFGVGDSLFRLGIVRALRLVPMAADLDDGMPWDAYWDAYI